MLTKECLEGISKYKIEYWQEKFMDELFSRWLDTKEIFLLKRKKQELLKIYAKIPPYSVIKYSKI